MRYIIYKKQERIVLLKTDLEIDNPIFADNITELEHNVLEIDDIYEDCQSSDFNEDLTFSVEKYNARKQKEYANTRIAELKQLLASQDYKTIKYMQGELTEEEFTKVKAKCKAWRDEINNLEGVV